MCCTEVDGLSRDVADGNDCVEMIKEMEGGEMNYLSYLAGAKDANA
jgi:hypothetical protein